MPLGSMSFGEYIIVFLFIILFCCWQGKMLSNATKKLHQPIWDEYNKWRVKYYCMPHDPELEEQLKQQYFKQIVIDPLPDFAKPHVRLRDCLPAYREQVLKMTADELHRRGMITEAEYQEAQEHCIEIEPRLNYHTHTYEYRKKRAEIYRDTGKD